MPPRPRSRPPSASAPKTPFPLFTRTDTPRTRNMTPALSNKDLIFGLRRISTKLQNLSTISDENFIVSCKQILTLLQFSDLRILTEAEQRRVVDTTELVIITFIVHILPLIIAKWTNQAIFDPSGSFSTIKTLFDSADTHINRSGDFFLQLRMAALHQLLYSEKDVASILPICSATATNSPPSSTSLDPRVPISSPTMSGSLSMIAPPTKIQLQSSSPSQSDLQCPPIPSPSLSVFGSPSPNLSFLRNFTPSPSPFEIQHFQASNSSLLSFNASSTQVITHHQLRKTPTSPNLASFSMPNVIQGLPTRNATPWSSDPRMRRSRSTSNVVSRSVKQDHYFPPHMTSLVRTSTPSFTPDPNVFMPTGSTLDSNSPLSTLTPTPIPIASTAASSQAHLKSTQPSSSPLSSPRTQSPSHADPDHSRNSFSMENLRSPKNNSNTTLASGSTFLAAPPGPVLPRIRARARTTSVLSTQTLSLPPLLASELTLPLPAKRKRVDKEPQQIPAPKKTRKSRKSRIASDRTGMTETTGISGDTGSNLGRTRTLSASAMSMEKENQDVMTR